MLIKSYESKKVADYLRQDKPNKIVLIFWHGLGDILMFIEPLNKLKSLFPNIQIDLALQKGVGQEVIATESVLISNANLAIDGYDYTFQIHFPMSEHTNGLWTKAEWCCKEELGIEPIDKYPKFPKNIRSNFVAVHFQATALPDACNPSQEIAEKIWNEIIEAGYIPIESFFRHPYCNPVNIKFDFIDRDIRGIPASIDKLIMLLNSCHASICVASGNLPLSIALMPTRTLYLEKAYPIKSYTKQSISSVNVNDYKDGIVKKWLQTI